jgi:uncharacterized protein YjlB
MNVSPIKFFCKDNGLFPNSRYPVLLYKNAMDLPYLFAAAYVKSLFDKNNWSNAWKSGIFTYNHYHSITHEVMGVYEGSTRLLLGGDNGHQVKIEKGDVLVIPAGVAHRNLGKENQVKCVGAYPDGRPYDMNYGRPEERPQTDKNISQIPIPSKDPLWGLEDGIPLIWPLIGQSAQSPVLEE